MNLTNKQKNELVVWQYFMPQSIKWEKYTPRDIELFFEWSEQGKHKDRKQYGDLSYFEALRQGKRWAGIHIHEMYEPSILEGSVSYFTLLGGYAQKNKNPWWCFWKPRHYYTHVPVPREVVEFMKKEMFKGKDAEQIETLYQTILCG